MDRFNKLRRKHTLQGRGPWHRWGRTTTSKQSKRTTTASTANTTRKSRARTYTSSFSQLVSHMCRQQRKSRQPPKATQQTTGCTVRLLLLQNSRWTTDNTNPDRDWRGNRHGNGNSGRRQTTRLSVPRTVHTSIPHGVRASTSSTQLNNPTIRPRRSPHSTVTNSGSQDGRKHYRSTISNIHITSTRQCRTIPQNTDGTSPHHQSTTTTKLWQNNHEQTSNCTLVGTTYSVPAQQICSTRRWQHQLLQKMEQEAYTPFVWIWRNSTVPTSNKQTTTKDGTTILSGDLARKRHNNRRNTPWHNRQSRSSTDDSQDAFSGKVQQAAFRRHQQDKQSAATSSRSSNLEPAHDLPSAEKINSPYGNTDSRSRGESSHRHTAATKASTDASNSYSSSQFTNGNSTHKWSHTTTTTFTQAHSSRWHPGRKSSETTTINSIGINRTGTSWRSNRKTQDKNEDHKSYDDYKTRNRNHRILMRRRNGTTDRKDPTGTMGQQHWRTG